MKAKIIIIFILLVATYLILILTLGAKTKMFSGPSNTSSVAGKIGPADITLELARTPAEHAQGLSDRKSLPAQTGKLFIFTETGKYNFWMKDMNFPIDMIWIDQDNRVVGIEPNISPRTYPNTFAPPVPILYVLEVNAGFSEQYGIKTGDLLSVGTPY